MIIALAGRRIDAANAEAARFPPRNVPLVRHGLAELFGREAAAALVSSAACGADLVALTVAGAGGMRRRVVLPFGRDEFRTTSVTDRPGDWGPLYDQVLAEVDRTGDVVILTGHAGDAAYAAANTTILDEASRLAREQGSAVLAVLVWEGAPRGGGDMTAAFGDEARRRGYRVEEVKTV